MAEGSLIYRILRLSSLTTFIALVILSITMVAYNLNNYKIEVTDSLRTQAALLARATKSAMQFHDVEAAQKYLSLFENQKTVIEAALFDPSGEKFAIYSTDSSNLVSSIDPRHQEGITLEESSAVLYEKLFVDGELTGIVYIKMKYDLHERIIVNVALSLAAVLVSLVLVGFLSLRLNSRLIRPLVELGDLAREITETKDYSLRVKKIYDDEIGVLAGAFNEMLAEVESQKRILEQYNNDLSREIKQKNATEKALIKSEARIAKINSELEQRVMDRTQQLESANQELEAFSYSVSHDLRSPLRAIDGFSQALLEDYEEGLDSTGKDYLHRVRNAAQRMGGLIDDILKLSKVNRTEMNKEELSLTDMANSLVQDLRQTWRDCKANISIADNIYAYCDGQLMRIALFNLLDNAIKYSSKIDKPEVNFSVINEAGQVVYCVEDNGAGFDMRYENKLFGAFQRLHLANDFPGTGIGLATVKRVITRHGGKIWASSELNKGAKFFFSLPSSSFSKATGTGV